MVAAGVVMPVSIIMIMIVVTLMTAVPVFVFVVGMIVRHNPPRYFSKNMTSRPSKQSSPPSTPLS